ncbi:alpha/beta family hydrolase [Microbacterium sp. 10M-3C3]|jgi:predicted alpha/beta-hydrolase family hydrolase|uniref:alpha/beta hydrolase family protein n=1 Tax=Microbacterium sp. 10M-3C3 TaxID=2483401 RepID=UPI000F640718|nr:alpha/beta family hydrolase [Microbacterium sp. 10M-3C3]
MTAVAHVVEVALPAGAQPIPLDLDLPADAWATIAVTHGAGAGRTHPFLTGFARGMWAAGVGTALFDLPYRAAGRRMPGPAAHAVAAWAAVMAHLDAADTPGRRWACGKSYGGRMASVAAAEGAIAPAGLVYLGYPLHPPGRPEAPRVAHLPAVTAAQLFLSGTRDPFVDPHVQLEDAVASCPDAVLEWVEGGDHSFDVAGRRRPADEVGEALAASAAAFLRSRA